MAAYERLAKETHAHEYEDFDAPLGPRLLKADQKSGDVTPADIFALLKEARGTIRASNPDLAAMLLHQLMSCG